MLKVWSIIAQTQYCLTKLCMISGLSYPVYKGVMKKGYKVPTPIQRKVSQQYFRIQYPNICDQ